MFLFRLIFVANAECLQLVGLAPFLGADALTRGYWFRSPSHPRWHGQDVSESWLVVTGTMEWIMTFQKHLGMENHPNWKKTPSFFRGVGRKTTNQTEFFMSFPSSDDPDSLQMFNSICFFRAMTIGLESCSGLFRDGYGWFICTSLQKHDHFK